MEVAIPEFSWFDFGKTLLYTYAGVSLFLTIILNVATYGSCYKTNFVSSLKLGFTMTIIPLIIYGLGLKFKSFKDVFSSVFQKMGISAERSNTFALIYILILSILPFTVYAAHAAEESACVATPDEMTAFKTKMLQELQEKQEAEEKNEKKK